MTTPEAIAHGAQGGRVTIYTVTPQTIGLTVDALVRDGARVICPRCKRELSPWPLGHRSCAPKYWVKCISTGVPTIHVSH